MTSVDYIYANVELSMYLIMTASIAVILSVN